MDEKININTFLKMAQSNKIDFNKIVLGDFSKVIEILIDYYKHKKLLYDEWIQFLGRRPSYSEVVIYRDKNTGLNRTQIDNLYETLLKTDKNDYNNTIDKYVNTDVKKKVDDVINNFGYMTTEANKNISILEKKKKRDDNWTKKYEKEKLTLKKINNTIDKYNRLYNELQDVLNNNINILQPNNMNEDYIITKKDENKISNIDILQSNNIDKNKNKNSNNVYTDSMSEVPKKLTKKQKQLIRELIEEFHILNSMKVKNIKINDLNESNVSELKQIAKDNNIKGYSTMRKQEIIDLLNEMRNTQFYKGREQTPEEKARDERIMNYVPQPVKPVIKKLSRDDMINELENKIANYEKKILEIEDKIDELNPIVHKKKIIELEKKIDEYNKLMNEDYTKLREINPYMY